MPLSAFPCVTYTVNSLEVYRSQLLPSTDRNLACLWSDLAFQITWIMRTVSCSTFAFSAQVFQFVLFLPQRDQAPHLHSSSSTRETALDPQGLSSGSVCWEHLLNYDQTFAIPTLPHKPDTSRGRERGFSWAFHVSVMRTNFLKRSRITITHLQSC